MSTGGATRMSCNWVRNEGMKAVPHTEQLSIIQPRKENLKKGKSVCHLKQHKQLFLYF